MVGDRTEAELDLTEVAPRRVGEQRELELWARFLVRDQQVALAGARGAAGERAAIDHADRQAVAGGVVGAAGADDARADDHDVVVHRPNLSMS